MGTTKKILSTAFLSLAVIGFGSVGAQSTVVCTDSDNGKNLAVKGKLSLQFFSGKTVLKTQNYEDFFSGSRNRYLEFYCNGNQPSYEIIACPNEELGAACPVIESLAAEPKIQVRNGNPIFPEMLVPGTNDFPVLNFRLKAYDGDVYLRGLHFTLNDPDAENADAVTLNEIDTAQLYSFELYDGLGNLISQTKSVAGRIHFQFLDSEFRLSGEEDFTIKVDLPVVESIDDSWRWFRLSLDKTYAGNGVQAVSTKTGNFVERVVLGQIGAWPSSQLFINAATKLSLDHADRQPVKVTPASGGQEFYHFTVTADRSGPVQIEKVTLEALFEGFKFSANPEARVFLVQSDGTLDFTEAVEDETTVTLVGKADQEALIEIDFKDQLILAGRTNTYALFLNRTEEVGAAADNSYAFTLLGDDKKSTTRDGDLLKTASNLVWSDFPGILDENRFMRGFLIEVRAAAKAFLDS
jgi:hypothetical protein